MRWANSFALEPKEPELSPLDGDSIGNHLASSRVLPDEPSLPRGALLLEGRIGIGTEAGKGTWTGTAMPRARVTGTPTEAEIETTAASMIAAGTETDSMTGIETGTRGDSPRRFYMIPAARYSEV